jgi:hypothetical protein
MIKINYNLLINHPNNRILNQILPLKKVLLKKQNSKKKEGKSNLKILLMQKIDVLKKIGNQQKSRG